MKQLSIDIEEYYEGSVPENITIADYLEKRRKENEEWEQYEKETADKASQDTTIDKGRLDGTN